MEAIEVSGVMRSAFVLMVAVALLAGCASEPKPMYDWSAYQQQVYRHLKGDEASIEDQRLKLEAAAAVAQGKSLVLPPGYRAHLGLLYLKLGRTPEARAAFETEKAMFPESTQYMNFLLRNFEKGAKRP